MAKRRASLRYVEKWLLERQPVELANSGYFPPSDDQLEYRDGPRKVVSLAECLELHQRKTTIVTGIVEGTSYPSRYSLTRFQPGVGVCLPLKPRIIIKDFVPSLKERSGQSIAGRTKGGICYFLAIFNGY